MSIPQSTEQMFQYFVSGIIVNDANGPRRWASWYDAPSPQRAEELACEDVFEQQVEGRHGILWVANVLQLSPMENGEVGISQVDGYAVYADDPNRQDGVAPVGGYTAPKGYEGWVKPERFTIFTHTAITRTGY